MAAMATKTKRKSPAGGTAKRIYFGARLDRELVDRLRRRALENDRSVGQELGRILRSAFNQEAGSEK